MSKVDLIKDRCIGCGACMTIAPDNFTYDDDGRAKLINIVATNEAIEASETCPVNAITISKSDSCQCGEACSCGDNCNCTPENKCSENCTCNE